MMSGDFGGAVDDFSKLIFSPLRQFFIFDFKLTFSTNFESEVFGVYQGKFETLGVTPSPLSEALLESLLFFIGTIAYVIGLQNWKISKICSLFFEGVLISFGYPLSLYSTLCLKSLPYVI